MAPPNPKRPTRPGPPPAEGAARPKPTTEVDLPFDTSEVTPLRADDPAPQRVAQYPASRRRVKPADQVPTEVMQIPGELSGFGGTGAETFRPVFLYVERGPGAGQLVPAQQGRLVIGRSSSSDLRLQHPSISRRHAELTRTGERFFLKDLASQNGTFVNKVRLLAEREVFPGDTLALGTAILKLRGPVSQGADLPVAAPRSRGLKLALFACAVGFGLAAILLYALLRSSAPPQVIAAAPANAPVPLPRPTEEGPLAPAPELRHAEQHEPEHQAPQVVAVQHEAPAPAHREPERSTQREPARHVPSHAKPVAIAHRDAQPAAKGVASRESFGNAHALDAYRQGELADALREASGPLADTLTRFQAEYNAGRRALAAHDPPTASRHFARALELDRAIAKGEGTFHGILRHELDALKTLEADDAAEAKKSPAPAPASARQSIDAAWGDAPAPKPAPAKKKPARSAIDAAFGD